MMLRCGLVLGSILLCAQLAAADQVLKTIPVGGEPTYSISNRDGSRVYVANAATSDVSVIDTESDRVIASIPLTRTAGAVDAVHLAMTPNDAYLFAVDENTVSNGTVNVVSTATNTVVATIPVGAQPTDIAIKPDGSQVFVVNHNAASLSVIDAIDWQVTAATVPVHPLHIAFSPDGRRAYVTHFGSSDDRGITVVDTVARSVVARIDDTGFANMVVASPDGRKLFVTYYDPSVDGGIVLRVVSTDTATDDYGVTAALTGPAATAWLTMASGGSKGYLISSASGAGRVIDGLTDAFTASFMLPVPGGRPAWDAATGQVLIPHSGGNMVTAIDAAADAIVGTYITGNEPWWITFAGGKKYVSNRQDGTVSVIGMPPLANTSTRLTSSVSAASFGQPATLTATVTSDSGTPIGRVQFLDGGDAIETVPLSNGGASLVMSHLRAGIHEITAVFVPDVNAGVAGSTSSTLVQTVNRSTGTLSLTIANVIAQYSDTATFTATFTPATSNGPAPSTVCFRVGIQVMGCESVNRVGKQYQAVWVGPLLEPVPNGQMKPGAHTVDATTADPNFVALTARRAINISREDARVTSTTPAKVRFSPAGTVILSAMVTEPADSRPGYIGNAQVSFVDRATGAVLGTANVVPNGESSGTATFVWTPPSSSKPKTFTIGFVVSNYYNRNAFADNAQLTVSR